MKKLICFLYLVVFSGKLLTAEEAPETIEKPPELARVAILNFVNTDNSKDHAWVETSLPDAIFASMQEKFEFIRSDKAQVQQIAATLAKTGSGYSTSEAAEIAKQSKSDIVILGSFRLVKSDETAQTKLVMNATIYNAAAEQIIGTAEESSTLDQQIFVSIDIMADQIVDQIYQFTLRTSGGQESTDDDRLRLLVMVPTYQTDLEKQQAISELEALRRQFSKNYLGRYLTIFEFFNERDVPAEEQEGILKLARERKQEQIVFWLKAMDVKDAFLIMVNDNKVNLTPVVAGRVEKAMEYPVGASPALRQRALAPVVRKAGLPEKGPGDNIKSSAKIALTKKGAGQMQSDTIRLHMMGTYGIPVGDIADFHRDTMGGRFDFSVQLFWPWLNPYVQGGYQTVQGKESIYDANLAFAHGGLSFPVDFTSSLSLTPYITAGASMFQLNDNIANLSFDSGLIFDWFFTHSVGFSLAVSLTFLPGSEFLTYYGQAHAGIGTRF